MRLYGYFERACSRLELDPTTTFVLSFGLVHLMLYLLVGRLKFYGNHLAPLFGRGVNAYVYWFGSCFIWLFLVPVAVIALHPTLRLKDFGLGWGERREGMKWLGILGAGVCTLLLIAALQEGFQDYYPLSKAVRSAAREGAWSIVLLYECMYAVYFIGWEFFFRSFLLKGTYRSFGNHAVLIAMLPFVVLHIHKPAPEALGSIVAGLVLGALALRTRSVWYGWALHVMAAVGMDAIALWVRASSR